MTTASSTEQPIWVERAAYVSLLAFAATPQFSIAAANVLLGLTAVLWLVLILYNRERIEVPPMFWPLAAYAGVTLIACRFSADPPTSFLDSKQLLLFAIVPIAYRLLKGERTLMAVDVIITVGALNAGLRHRPVLAARPRQHQPASAGQPRTLRMTYSGVIMLVAAQLPRGSCSGAGIVWAALILPAVLVALALTLSRNAWVGACANRGTVSPA